MSNLRAPGSGRTALLVDDNVVNGGLFTSASAGLRQYVKRVAGTRERKPSSCAGIFKSCVEGNKRRFAVSKTGEHNVLIDEDNGMEEREGKKGVVQKRQATKKQKWETPCFAPAATRFVEGHLQL